CTILPPHVRAYWPSGLNEAPRTPPGWRSTGPIGRPVAASQSRASGGSFHETSTGRTPPRPRESFPQGRGANAPTAPVAYIEIHIDPNPESRDFPPSVSKRRPSGLSCALSTPFAFCKYGVRGKPVATSQTRAAGPDPSPQSIVNRPLPSGVNDVCETCGSN